MDLVERKMTMVNGALWNAIEAFLDGGRVAPEPQRKPRKLTPFNREGREQKIKRTAAHCARHPADKQSETHLAAMEKRLAAG